MYCICNDRELVEHLELVVVLVKQVLKEDKDQLEGQDVMEKPENLLVFVSYCTMKII